MLASHRSAPCQAGLCASRAALPARHPVDVHKRNAFSSSRRALRVCAAIVEPGATVLVAGATGGVGQLITAKLIERGYKVRALTRSSEKARSALGTHPALEFVEADARVAETLTAAMQGVDAVCCATGAICWILIVQRMF